LHIKTYPLWYVELPPNLKKLPALRIFQ